MIYRGALNSFVLYDLYALSHTNMAHEK